MRTLIALAVVLAGTVLVQAKDITLTLNENEVSAFKQVLDVATRAQGMQIAPLAVYLTNKLNAAENPPPPPPPPQHPPEQKPPEQPQHPSGNDH